MGTLDEPDRLRLLAWLTALLRHAAALVQVAFAVFAVCVHIPGVGPRFPPRRAFPGHQFRGREAMRGLVYAIEERFLVIGVDFGAFAAPGDGDIKLLAAGGGQRLRALGEQKPVGGFPLGAVGGGVIAVRDMPESREG